MEQLRHTLSVIISTKTCLSGSSKKEQPRPQQPLNCRLPRLPTELIMEISDYLRNSEALILSLTCRELCCKLSRSVVPYSSLSNKDKRIFLRRIANSLPHHWVCNTCSDVHKIRFDDTPLTVLSRVPFCPRDWYNTERAEWTPGMNHFRYRLQPRHAQICLKYQKRSQHLSTEEKEHLETLMQPHHALWSSKGSKPSETFASNSGDWFSIFPKIVSERFLIFSAWSFTVEKPEDTALVKLMVCKHQLIGYRQTFHGTVFFGTPPCTSNCQRRMSKPYISCYRYELNRVNTCCAAQRMPFPEALEKASHNHGLEFKSSCPFCYTDFAVKFITPTKVIVCVWQDRGALRYGAKYGVRGSLDVDPTMYDPSRREGRSWHPAGSIREAYGHGDLEIQTFWAYMLENGPSMDERLHASGVCPVARSKTGDRLANFDFRYGEHLKKSRYW